MCSASTTAYPVVVDAEHARRAFHRSFGSQGASQRVFVNRDARYVGQFGPVMASVRFDCHHFEVGWVVVVTHAVLVVNDFAFAQRATDKVFAHQPVLGYETPSIC